uniref:ABC1 atypical kinase-like domain-containing protein n=1 Tax=Timspurckia oligopyrenoides TaxID=708627 RepID=A0A7S1ERJ9_9RHOD|mmetsp:Transcript_2376/g.4160  ORF Transcript_2376/g.4160 Transcript_2376/m.4160 type:complete len:599 (+) Transcript_2376:33-1829(+)
MSEIGLVFRGIGLVLRDQFRILVVSKDGTQLLNSISLGIIRHTSIPFRNRFKVQKTTQESHDFKDSNVNPSEIFRYNEAQTHTSPEINERTDLNRSDSAETAQVESISDEVITENPQEMPSNRSTEEATLFKQEEIIEKWKYNERKVPSSAISRAFGFGTLGLRMAFGVASESARNLFPNESSNIENRSSALNSYISKKESADQIVSTLSRMRGAALKVGQMLSIQDETLLPPALSQALERVRHNADIMPNTQLEFMMKSELGSDWKQNFKQFNNVPIAAASIGQVHKAILTDGTVVAVKVQYPGVAQSIQSDIKSLRRLIKYSGMLPKSAYVEQALAYAEFELGRECQYKLEANNQKKLKKLLEDEGAMIVVPDVIESLSTDRVLTTEWASGKHVDEFSNPERNSQEVRNQIAETVLRLTMRELFEFKFMQTDPNFSNFLYDKDTNRMSLLDFGAAREYASEFVSNYFNMVNSCAERDREGVIYYSQQLGFLTGEESLTMLDAHVSASFIVGEPFSKEFSEGYDFKKQQISTRTAAFGSTLMKLRLCPPPQEVYSLHRRLSGAYLLCVKLGATLTCRPILEQYRSTLTTYTPLQTLK